MTYNVLMGTLNPTHSLTHSLSYLSPFYGHFPGGPGLANTRILDFIADKGDGGGGDSWSYKTCKAPVKSSPPTNQHPAFYWPDALPVTQPTVSEHWSEVSLTRLFIWYQVRRDIVLMWQLPGYYEDYLGQWSQFCLSVCLSVCVLVLACVIVCASFISSSQLQVDSSADCSLTNYIHCSAPRNSTRNTVRLSTSAKLISLSLPPF